MQDVIAYLNKNVLKLTTVDNGNFKSHKSMLAKETVDGTRILDAEAFATVLKDSMDSLQLAAKQKPALTFVLGPADVILMFVAINKRDGDIDTQIITEVKSRLKGIPLEDLYFSYQKVAPFVYQFVAVFKDTLNTYIQVSDILQVPVKSVMPWVLLLPKYVNLNDPAIFVCSDEEVKIVALSEFNGIFFSDIVDEDETAENMQKLITKLSFYKRSKPINTIFTLNSSLNGSDGNYSVKTLELPVTDVEGAQEFAINVIANYMLDTNPFALGSQMNLLNTLPLPAVPEKKNTSLVYVGAAVGSMAVVALLVGGFLLLKGHGPATPNSANLANETSSQVLSAQEPTQSATPTPSPTPEVKLNKSDLMIRVENGAGTPGLAARTKEFLEKAGYRVLPPETADANRTSTLLRFKKSKLAYKDLVINDVKEVFPNSVVEDTLDESSPYDLLFVAGTTAEL